MMVDVDDVQTDQEINEYSFFLRVHGLGVDATASREGNSSVTGKLGVKALSRLWRQRHQCPRSLVGKENSFTFTRRCDAYILFSMQSVRKEGLDDEVVLGSSNRFNLQIELVIHL